MGVVKLLMDILIKIKGMQIIEAWGKSRHIMRHGFHGGAYDGNNSKRILDNLDHLEAHLPDVMDCLPIIDAMKAFKAIVSG